MKRFIINVFIFCLFALIVSFALDLLISHYLRQSKTYAAGEYSTWNDLYEGSINSEIVIYGSSRAVVHIDPTLIQNALHKTCYNLGTDGNNIWMEYFRHQQLLQTNVKPTLIIHSLDIFMLSDSTRILNSEQFLPYMLFDSELKKFNQNNRDYSWFDYHIPMVRYSGNKIAMLHAIKLLFNPHQESAGRIRGYEGQNLLWNTDLQEAKLKMKSFEAEVDSSSVFLFEMYIQECKKQNIELIFVYSPEYIEGQHFVRNRKAILDRYFTFSKKYKIPYFDYSADSISFNKEYFYNSGHLNKQGSAFFTEKLAADLKEVLEEMDSRNGN